MKLNCLIVDDDEMSRNVISHFISKTDFLELVETFENAIEASNYLKSGDIDVIFLDINMPEMTGMEMIQTLDEDFEVILITSASQYAVEAFEKSVTDYLVKPVDYARFLKASQKALKNIETKRLKTDNLNEIYVKADNKLVRLQLDNLIYVEALADYVIIHTPEKKYIVHYTMKGIENRLPSKQFARIHRSYIVNTERIDALEDNSIVIKDKYLPIGASYKESLMGRLNLL
ncbi:MAG TPA: DNA-binding response regulator [Cytophagales bacterium]|jgi:DNA-binding LytR/AlgR family response regulator|nr:DNA-binding response regulator [Cytophagales bacterium]